MKVASQLAFVVTRKHGTSHTLYCMLHLFVLLYHLHAARCLGAMRFVACTHVCVVWCTFCAHQSVAFWLLGG